MSLICQLANIYMGHMATMAGPPSPIALSFDRQTYGDMWPQLPGPSTSVSDKEPTNVIHYICRCHITDEHKLASLALMNIWPYILSAIYLSASSSVNRRIYNIFIGLNR
jgi:hypothetical protein